MDTQISLRVHEHTRAQDTCVFRWACAHVRPCVLTDTHAPSHTGACASYCPLLCRWASFGPRGVLKMPPPTPFWGLELFPEAGLLPSLPESWRRWGAVGPSPVPRILQLGPGSGAEAWAGQAASPRAQPPRPPCPRWRLHYLLAYRPAGRGLSGIRPLPSRLPSGSYPGLWPPGSAGGPAAWMFGDFYWRLQQDEGRGGPSGLPEPLYWSRPSRRAAERPFPGESGFSAGLAPLCLCVWLGSAWPGLF